MQPDIPTSKWSFGNDEFAKKLLALVQDGRKTATTGLYKSGESLPKVGDQANILDIDGKPCLTIEYTKIEVKPFLEVDYDFAILEGEGDKNIDEWRNNHRKYFAQHYGKFSDQSLVVCEQFKLISDSKTNV